MSWRDRYRRGSFKGIEFFTASSDIAGGRRSQVVEFPYQNEHFADDLGLKARTYQIDGFIVGSDYFNARNNFIKACEDPESGELIHPYYDDRTLNVICQSFSISETLEDGGMFKFSASFVEKGNLSYPKAITKPSTLIDNAIAKVYSSAEETYINSIYVENVPDFVRGGAQSIFQKLGKNLQLVLETGALVSSLKTDLFNINSPTLLETNINRLSSLDLFEVSDSVSLLNLIRDTFNLVSETAPEKKKRLIFKRARQDLSLNPLNPVTDSNRQFNDNILISKSFIEVLSVTEEAKVIVSESFDNYQEAINSRNYITDEIDVIVNKDISDSMYDSLQNLKKVIHSAVPNPSQKLPLIKSIELTQGLPSLVISHLIYGTKDKADSIVARNKEKHPGFISPRILEVLVDE